MQIFYAPDILKNQTLPEEESAHAIRVLRLTPGTSITITDGAGFFYSAQIMDPHPKRCIVEIIETTEQAKLWPFHLHIAIAPTKNMDRMEWFVEKATEIGIDEITFLKCRYSERRDIKVNRLEKIAVSAMKQSQKATCPTINGFIDFNKFVQQPFDCEKYIAHCEEAEKALLKQKYLAGKNALILIGPEGDFSKDEIEQAQKQSFIPVSLGKSRLRTETAALVACQTFQLINQ